VEASSVNLATEQAKVRLKAGSDITIDNVIALVQKTGYEAKLSTPHKKPQQNPVQSFWGTDGLGRVLLGFTLSAPLFLPMLLMPFGIHWALSPKWQLLLASPVQFFLGWRF
jgi:Cu+-exporting ATPase